MQDNMIENGGRVQIIWDPRGKENEQQKEQIETRPLRTAAYCRVSTDLGEQEESFEFQERYYARLISNTPGLILAGIYSDKGISGTGRRHRVGFERLLRHCEEGKIDKILCKSISRFTRNTVDLLDTVRHLKEIGVGVVFEKEGIDTLSMQSEFILSAIAAISQDESRNIADNMAWSFKKRFQQGIPVFKRIMGYDVAGKGAYKTITINEKEAAIVKLIYTLALEGTGYKAIAERMMKEGHKTFDGKREWTIDRVKGILENERYTGNVICQKTYTANYLNHKTVRNRGERPQYLLKNHHPAIIKQEVYDEVQKIIKSRERGKPIKNNVYPLTGRVFCGDCGSKYHRFSTNGNGRWACSLRMKSKSLCNADNISEKELEKVMQKAFSKRYDFGDRNLIHKIRLDLKVLKENDNHIEKERIAIKNKLAETLYETLHAEGEKQKKAEERRMTLEKELEDHEKFWALLEKDRSFRENSLSWLDSLPYGDDRTKIFFEELNIPYMRAWIISITILAPTLFRVRWFDNTETMVNKDEAEEE